MEAANAGAKDGGSKTKSFGLHIDLPFETSPNKHLDVTYHHKRFSSRLDEFMRISHAVIVTPGGIGTVLELLYTWQLIQVRHISERPIILLGEMWNGLLDWMESEPLNKKLMDKSDFKNNLEKYSQGIKFFDLMYPDSVDNSQITEHAIRYMLEQLDPHSTYISLKDIRHKIWLE